jgi:acyl dehydratase
MPIQPALLLNHVFPEIRHRYTKRDTILYALGVGLGANPTDPSDLEFLLEDRLRILPTFAVTLGSLGMWIRQPEFGADFAKLVHYEQAAKFYSPLPAEAEILARARVVNVYDRGEGKGAVVVLEREIHDANLEITYCTLKQTLLLRGDGGFGGDPPPFQPSLIPERNPDALVSVGIDERAALLYRLSGDWNPLHVDPAAAKRGGFDKPILHGLASYAIAGVAVSRKLGLTPDTLTSLNCRFSGVVYPGDAFDLKIWRDGQRGVFQAFVGDRKVLDQGLVTLGEAP